MSEEADWIEWKGGQCPVKPGTKIDIKMRNGDVAPTCRPAHLAWSHAMGALDIIAYRVVYP